MKTAISIPDDTYAAAMQGARDLGWSRSEFFTRAARHYLGALDRDSVETQINASLELLDQPDESGADAVALAHRLLSADEW